MQALLISLPFQVLIENGDLDEHVPAESVQDRSENRITPQYDRMCTHGRGVSMLPDRRSFGRRWTLSASTGASTTIPRLRMASL